jgi:hypothetical protein
VLAVVLVVLVVMMLGGVSTLRSIDTSSILSGNLAFKRDSVNRTTVGMNAAFKAMQSGFTDGLLANCVPTSPDCAGVVAKWVAMNYSPRLLETDGNGIPLVLKDKTTFDAKFSTIKPNKADGTLEGGNETRFIIERMCSDYGPSDEKKCSVSDRYERGGLSPGQARLDLPSSTGSPFAATVCATRRPTSRLRSLLASSNPETSRRMLQMKISTFVSRSGLSRVLAAAALAIGIAGPAGAAKTPLADQPILVADVPANVLLTMSVEFPTAMNRAFRRL